MRSDIGSPPISQNHRLTKAKSLDLSSHTQFLVENPKSIMATEEQHHHRHQQQTKAQMQMKIQIQNQQRSATDSGADSDLRFGERAFSAAGAALISALLVNPLDIAKTRLQAQAAGIPYRSNTVCLEPGVGIPDLKSSVSRTRSALGSEPACHPGCGQYRGTIDVLYKVFRQEGFSGLWRGTNASLALAIPTVGIYLPCYDLFRDYVEDFAARNTPSLIPYVPLVAGSASRSLACVTCYPIELARTRMQAFKERGTAGKPPGVWRTLQAVVYPAKKNSNFLQNVQRYCVLWTGLGAQLARDVPFSAICWSTLEPLRRTVLGLVGGEASAGHVFGANFTAGFVAGSLAAATTCPLDVARTRQQIEKDPERALKMTTRKTLAEIWRDGGVKGLFTGVGPRVARTGPSVGIVVSFYEVVKYTLHQRRSLVSGGEQ